MSKLDELLNTLLEGSKKIILNRVETVEYDQLDDIEKIQLKEAILSLSYLEEIGM